MFIRDVQDSNGAFSHQIFSTSPEDRGPLVVPIDGFEGSNFFIRLRGIADNFSVELGPVDSNSGVLQ